MSIRNKGLVFAMENDGDMDSDDAEVTGVPGEIESDASEIMEDSAEISDLNDGIGDAVTDSTTLGQICEVMDESVEKGEGLSEDAAKIAEIAIEAIRVRLGIPESQRFMPSMESFGSTSSRVTATRIALEEGKNWLVRIWESIKEAFSKVWNQIMDFLKKTFGAAERLEAFAKKVRTAVDAIGNKKATASAFESSSVANAFVAGTAVNKAVVSDYLVRHTEFIEAALKFSHLSENTGKAIEESLKAVADAKKEDKTKAIADHIDAMSVAFTSIKNGSGLSTRSVNNAYDQKTFGPFVGGSALVVELDKAGAAAEAPHLVIRMEAGDKKASSTSVKTLDVTEMKAIVGEVETLAKNTKEFNRKNANLGKLKSSFDSAINKAIKMAEGQEGDNKASVDGLKELRKTVSWIGNSTATVYQKAPALSIAAGKAALGYVVASLKQYKAEKQS